MVSVCTELTKRRPGNDYPFVSCGRLPPPLLHPHPHPSLPTRCPQSRRSLHLQSHRDKFQGVTHWLNVHIKLPAGQLFTFFQFFLQVLDLLLKLPQQSVLGILVDSGLVLDVFSSVSVAQGANGLIVVVVCRPYVGTLVGWTFW